MAITQTELERADDDTLAALHALTGGEIARRKALASRGLDPLAIRAVLQRIDDRRAQITDLVELVRQAQKDLAAARRSARVEDANDTAALVELLAKWTAASVPVSELARRVWPTDKGTVRRRLAELAKQPTITRAEGEAIP